MATKATYNLGLRRRADNKTNYNKRLKLVKSGKPRFVVRKSNTKIVAQLIKYSRNSDITLAEANSQHLRKFEWKFSGKSIPAAYLVGYLCGLKARKEGFTEGVLDIGLSTPILGTRIFAVLKGAIDAGLELPAGETQFPKEERIKGEHIQKFAESMNDDDLKRRFSKYFKENADPRKFVESFEKTKSLISKEFGA